MAREDRLQMVADRGTRIHDAPVEPNQVAIIGEGRRHPFRVPGVPGVDDRAIQQ
jgi:hypothetical protein